MMISRMKGMALCLLQLILVTSLSGQSITGPASVVNPFIGTGGHGHTYPGVCVPFGMVQLSPDTRLEGWDGCSAYHYSDSVIYGFSHTHLSGTGCSDYGDILLMPVNGDPDLKNYGYASQFFKKEEMAYPGYYRVNLLNNNVLAELTSTARVGFHKYAFRSDDAVNIIVDLKHRDKVIGSGITVVSDTEIEGFRISKAWAENQMVYFVARFSKPFASLSLASNDEVLAGATQAEGEDIKAIVNFGTQPGQTIFVKVALSGVSTAGARLNLERELPGWAFDSVVNQAVSAWNNELSKIVVEGGSTAQQAIFSTALYHTMLQPNVYNDVDGNYRGRDLKIHKADSFDYYTVFSLWDTYRAAHPLYTIIDRKRSNDFIQTFLRQYDEGGMLPVWELSSNETGCMIGYHAVPVIADAWLKGIRNYDGEKALKAMQHSANQDHLGLKYYKGKGYIPADQEGESVSKTLEYSFDDWCIAMMAKAMGKQEVYREFIARAQNYKNIFDRMTGFMRAKSNERWFTPFDPAEVNFNYTEANAWQYGFYAPQDFSGLLMMMGGRDKFTEKLNKLFSADSKTTGREQADITGLIGQYAHGNEPSHHMAYLYDYVGEPWKTQELVHRICQDFYKASPDGLIGNEDCGQMSAWYVFSALGFYPVTPATDVYAIGTPLFPKASIRLESGKKFVIRAVNLSADNFYIQAASLNGRPLTKSFITHGEIMQGGELVFTMGPSPNKAWGSGYGSFPATFISEYPITPVPSLVQGDHTFIDSTIVAMMGTLSGLTIHYTLDGSEPTLKSPVYMRPFEIRKSTTLKAFAIGKESPRSKTIEARFIKVPKNRKITLATSYAGQYAAGGDIALIDFARGGENFRTGKWQGYEGVNLDATIDLGSVQGVDRLALGCFQEQGAWIFMPEKVTFLTSVDGNSFTEVAALMNDVNEKESGAMTKEFSIRLKDQKIRFVRVIATNRGVCPAWHAGAGGKAWIFADEIIIE